MKKTAILLSVLVLAAAIIIGVQVAQRNTLDQQKTEALDQVAALQGDLSKKGHELSQAQEQVTQLTAGKADLETQLSGAQEQLTELTTQKADLETRLGEAQQQVTSLTAEKADLETRLSGVQDQLDGLTKEKGELETKLGEAQQQLSDASGQAAQLTQEKEKLTLDLAETQVKLDTANLSVEGLQAKLAELTKLEGDYQALQQKHDELVEAAKVTPEPVDPTKSEEYLALLQKHDELVEAAKVTPEPVDPTKSEEYAALQQKYDEAVEAAKVTPEPMDPTKSEQYAALQSEFDALKVRYDELTAQAKLAEEPQAPDVAPEEAPEAAEIALFFTNSVLQRVNGDDEAKIGYPRLATFLKDAREGAQVLLLDAGDALFGSRFPADGKGEQVVELMNLLGYDAAVPGYYDFALGVESLKALPDKANHDLLGSNLLDAGDKPIFKPYVIRELAGHRIALVGAMAPSVAAAAAEGRFEGLKVAGLEKVSESVAAARAEGAEAVILLAYGHDEDADLLGGLPDVDLVVLGRNKPGELERRVGDTLVLGAGSQLRSIGHAVLRFDEQGMLSITPSFITFDMVADTWPDAEVQQLTEMR